jgi:GDP-4-dehydro-6-deoxy-D-mannose reductase
LPDVLVTGAGGFVGRHLLPRLHQVGLDTATLGRAEGDIAAAGTWTNAPPCPTVIHLAGRSFVPESWEHPAEFLATNLGGTAQALDYCRRHGAALVLMSSYLYGRPRSLPIFETDPIETVNPYAFSKKAAEDAARFFNQAYGIPVTILRPFNIYGPGQPLHFLIPEIVEQLLSGPDIEVKDLDPRRDYVFVGDVVEAIVKAARQASEAGLTIYNIGAGRSHSVGEIVALAQELAGTHWPVRTTGQRRANEIMDTVAGITAASAGLAWAPATDLADGLRQVIAHARAAASGAPQG